MHRNFRLGGLVAVDVDGPQHSENNPIVTTEFDIFSMHRECPSASIHIFSSVVYVLHYSW